MKRIRPRYVGESESEQAEDQPGAGLLYIRFESHHTATSDEMLHGDLMQGATRMWRAAQCQMCAAIAGGGLGIVSYMSVGPELLVNMN